MKSALPCAVTQAPMLHLTLSKFAHIRIERALALVLWCTLFGALCLYGYFIVSSIINVMLRQELMVSIQDAEAQVSKLEAQYLARAEELSNANLQDAGLVAVSEVSYVPITGKDERLSRRP
jgi:hypothetical protein